MTTIPASHITDAQKLEADGIVELFELSPISGGTLYFKRGNTQTWQGNEYVGLPCGLSDWKQSAEKVAVQPRLTIGEENIDLSIFKPLLFDGTVDGAAVIYRRVLLDHIIANSPISQIAHFRVKRVESYSRSRVILGLSSASDSINFTLPNLQYFPPAYPAVSL